MKGVYDVFSKIKDEIREAEEYLELCREYKTLNPDKAKMFLALSKEETAHAERLIDMKHKMCQKTKAEGGSDAYDTWCDLLPFFTTEIAELKAEIESTERSMY